MRRGSSISGGCIKLRHGRPWIRVKIAASLDGRTALENGASQWITGEAARADGHRWRARACAILTGIGTVLQDDPQLNVRASRRHGSRSRSSSIATASYRRARDCCRAVK